MLTHAVRRAARLHARGTATVDGSRRRCWAESAARIARLAGGLQHAGVRAGERVAVLALNSDRYFEALYAVLWAGAVVVPLNVRWAQPEIAEAVADSGARMLMADATFWPLAAAVAPAGRAALLWLDAPPAPGRVLVHEDLAMHGEAIAGADREGSDAAGIFYTGGTTGRAKGVVLSHANLMANAMANIAKLALGSGEVYLHAAPMFHLADGLATWAVTMVGGSHVFVPRFEAQTTLAAIAREKVSFITLVPTMVQALLEAHAHAGAGLQSLRKLFYGASAMPEPVLRRAIEALPGCAIHGAYGMTELAPIATILDPCHHTLDADNRARLRSVGRATLGLELRVVDGHGRELPAGEVGELVARGPNVMSGYWNRPQETRAALRAGWLHTGDLARMDAEGFVYIVDRLKDMIVSGGENVYSAEVENALYQFSGVSQCAVIGVPDDRWGERVHAIVVPAAGAAIDPAALLEHCRRLIAGYKCPRSIELRDTPLPLSGAGKVLKSELRRPWIEPRRV